MYPEPIDEYHAPRDLGAALELLARHRDGAKVLAGGQSLMPLLKARLVAPRVIVDLNRVSALEGVRDVDGGIEIGALVRFADVLDDARLRRDFTALVEAAAAIGDRQVRNRGTLVGSLVFAASWGDVAPAAAVLEARVVVARAGAAEREEPVGAFVRSAGRTALGADEIVTALRLPLPAGRSGSAYVKHGRVHQDRATIGVAARVTLDPDGRSAAVRVAVGGLGAGPIVRPSAVEAALHGRPLDAAALAEAGELAASLEAQSDELATAEYRRQLLRVHVPLAIERALARAKGDAE
jgi:aerobic carbon-monoxide dehydrogenase medium subunit